MKLNIRNMRKSAGLTQAELAERMGVNLSTIGNWERLVTCPDAEQIWNCAVALGCTPNDILGWHEDRPSESGREDLTPEEREIVDCYRESAPQWRQNIAMTARSAAATSKDAAERAVSAPGDRAAV